MPIVTLSDLNKKSSFSTPTNKKRTASSLTNDARQAEQRAKSAGKRKQNTFYTNSGVKISRNGSYKVEMRSVVAETEHDRYLTDKAKEKQKIGLDMNNEVRLYFYINRSKPTVRAQCKQSHKLTQAQLNNIWNDYELQNSMATNNNNNNNDTQSSQQQRQPSIVNSVLQRIRSNQLNIDDVLENNKVKCITPNCPEYVYPTLTVSGLYTDHNKYTETVPYVSTNELYNIIQQYAINAGYDNLRVGKLIHTSPVILWNCVKHYGTVSNALKNIFNERPNTQMNRKWEFYENTNQLI